MRIKLILLVACVGLIPAACAAQPTQPMAYKAAATSRMGNLPVLPKCMTLAIQEGDPAKGPLIVLAKFTPGCTVAWHYHSANERLLIVSGTGKGEMRDVSKPLTLKPGDYLLLPAKGIHQFTAMTKVELFLLSDGAFDIHYVDLAGKEIAVDAALKGN
jgi:quercetin dioxygenase-like cupin family protein